MEAIAVEVIAAEVIAVEAIAAEAIEVALTQEAVLKAHEIREVVQEVKVDQIQTKILKFIFILTYFLLAIN